MTITNTEGLSELLPCPFCGGEAFSGTTLDGSGYAMCKSDECWGMAGYLSTEAEARTAWNRRSANSAGRVTASNVRPPLVTYDTPVETNHEPLVRSSSVSAEVTVNTLIEELDQAMAGGLPGSGAWWQDCGTIKARLLSALNGGRDNG